MQDLEITGAYLVLNVDANRCVDSYSELFFVYNYLRYNS